MDLHHVCIISIEQDAVCAECDRLVRDFLAIEKDCWGVMDGYIVRREDGVIEISPTQVCCDKSDDYIHSMPLFIETGPLEKSS